MEDRPNSESEQEAPEGTEAPVNEEGNDAQLSEEVKERIAEQAEEPRTEENTSADPDPTAGVETFQPKPEDTAAQPNLEDTGTTP